MLVVWRVKCSKRPKLAEHNEQTKPAAGISEVGACIVAAIACVKMAEKSVVVGVCPTAAANSRVRESEVEAPTPPRVES